jgi:hypothetical protein
VLERSARVGGRATCGDESEEKSLAKAEAALSSRYPRCVCAFARRSACSSETAVVGDVAGVVSVMAVLRSANSCVVEARVVVVKNSGGGALLLEEEEEEEEE